MAKVKNKKSKKNLADTYAQRRKERQQTNKTISPFEVHATKNKKQVLGRKSKNDTGLPGISRSKAIDKRKRTLLVEYKVKDKDNLFLDRRIGERNAGMTEEDKAIARFAAERVKAHKKSIYNLNDDEVLTHRGQALVDVEKYDDPRSDEESDDDKPGKLGKKFVEEAHFGGGMLSKPNSEMSRKDVIDKLIAESKLRKAERQMNKEKNVQLTEQLDAEWKDLIPLLAPNRKTKHDVVEDDRNTVDDYDKAMRAMQFDKRGRPTDKLKSEEEVVKQEKMKLEKLEADRLARIEGFSDETEFQKKHRSADDIDDFHIEAIEEKSDDEIVEEEQEKIVVNGKRAEVMEESDEENNENEEGSEEGSGGDEEEEDENEDEDEDEDEESGESEEESEDELSDLKASESESEEEQTQVTVEKKAKVKNNTTSEKILPNKTEIVKNNVKKNEIESVIQEKVSLQTEKVKETTNSKRDSAESQAVKEREAIIQKIRKELPATIKAPESYEELISLFKNRNPIYQAVIVERIKKCNDYKESTENRQKMLHLFTFLLQYLDNCATTANNSNELLQFFRLFDRLCPELYDLRDANVQETKTHLCKVLKEKHDQFESNIKCYPGLDVLMLFKLVSILYPTSDFRHPIVTPCLVFMSQILLRCKVRRKTDITKGLFICTLMLEYTTLSERWSPEAINFLRGIIYASLPKPFPKVLKVIPPFKQTGDASNILVLEKSHKKSECNLSNIKMSVKDFTENEIDEDFRLRTFVSAINLLSDFLVQCNKLDVVYTIFEPILDLLNCGSVKRYPKEVREKVLLLVNELEKLKERKLDYLQFDKKKPKALRMLEPKIEKVYDGKKHANMTALQQERQKLQAKLKSEKKSAMREIRRDTAFLANVKLKEQVAADDERKRKVREIFGDAATQQHELKKLKRQK